LIHLTGILGVSLGAELIRIKSARVDADCSIKSDDRDKQSEKFPAGCDQQHADGQETTVPEHGGRFALIQPLWCLPPFRGPERSYFDRLPVQWLRTD
jgi:hypothetical protein